MKKLYYVRGGSGAPKYIKQSLLNKGGIDDLNLYFDSEDVIYYINEESKIRCAIDMKLKELILYYGTELKPIEPEETFEPGDKVLVSYNGYWEFSIFSHTTPEGQIHCCGVLYDECHHYEPWMKKYLGTTIAFNDFIKG